MAVEARHLNLFPSQLTTNRESMSMLNPSNQRNVNSAYNPQQMRFVGIPLPENQSYYQTAVCDSVQAKTSVNTDSGLTYNVSAPNRKRSRDSINHQVYAASPNYHAPPKTNNTVSQFAAGENIMPQIQQYQSEIDAIISQHTKKIKLELEEKQKQQARLLAMAIGEGVMKKLKEKDEQLQRISKFNFALQERVKSLYLENQLWRDLAQSNEAAANSLRTNLEQVLLQIGTEERVSAAADEDVQSCCGSSDYGREAEEKDDGNNNNSRCFSDRRCKMCGEREACVLLLPCRHLCLCGVCGSGSQQLQACPVCNSSMNATLHVNTSL
ncbi:hypothetical protein ACP275_13G197900 [Erythranthe tilingii]